MKQYTVKSSTEVFETDSLEEATSIMESMAQHFSYACVIDNTTNDIIDEYST